MTCQQDVPPLDCFLLLKELDAAGVNNAEVGRRLGIGKSVVYGWKMGAEPAWHDGERLRQLHAYEIARAHASGLEPCEVRNYEPH